MRIKPFRGLRPKPCYARQVASRPYDVLNSAEARAEAAGNPYSFLNVVKPEITLPAGVDSCAPAVYQAGRENFQRLLAEGVFVQDERECLYIYELSVGGHSQDGIVACAWVEDYRQGRIRRHELTRPDKEEDRKNHLRAAMLNAEPVLFAYRTSRQVDEQVAKVKQAPPACDFIADDGVRHRLWLADDTRVIEVLIDCFAAMNASYVADGHHRTAAAARVAAELAAANPAHSGTEAYNYFLAVHFPDTQLQIMDYNRVVKDLNGLRAAAFVARLEAAFIVQKLGATACKPQRAGEIGMYLDGDWYRLVAKDAVCVDKDPIAMLDVSILSRHILAPILGVHDLRRDQRIDFIGGARGLAELQRLVDDGEMRVAFAMRPVSMRQLMDIADAGLIMPPKVTWFEPKLRSGLVAYSLAG